MRHIDGYLSRLAQMNLHPSSLIFVGEDGLWVLEREGQDPVGLGDNFQRAGDGLRALVRAQKK
ncbi:MAG TPA: hypothetical protein VJL09_01085 [Candidatus Paceibacterota bacterium]